MPLLKPSKTVSRRIKRSIPLSFHPSAPPASAPAPPASFPLPKSICSSASAAALPPKERVVRVICTDPDATDSSSEEEEEEEEEAAAAAEEEKDGQGGVEDETAQDQEEGTIPLLNLPQLPNRKRRLVNEACLPTASASLNTSGLTSRYGSTDVDDDDDDGNHHAKKPSRRELHHHEAVECDAFQSCGSSIHSASDQDEFCRLFPSDLFALPDGAGDSVDGESWEVGWLLPEDDSLFNDADLHIDFPVTTAWFDSLHTLPS